MDAVGSESPGAPLLVAGVIVFALSSLAGGLASSQGVLVGARLVQGVGAALMSPAALSELTTTFSEGKDRNTALGVWGAVSGMAAAAGVFFGGLLSAGPGWRWVLFVNPPICVAVTTAANAGVPGDKAGLAAGLLNASQQVGSALGLAILSAIAITRTNDLLAAHTARLDALDAGYHRGLLVGSIFLIGAAVIALRIGNTRAAAPLVLAPSAAAPEHADI